MLILLLSLLSSACEKPMNADYETPPSAYLHFTDKLKAVLRLNGLPGPEPCMGKAKIGGNWVPVPIEGELCWRLEPPRRWRGLYFVGADHPRLFCGAPAKGCPPADWRNVTWVEQSKSERWKPTEAGVFAVDFIGRHTTYHSDGKRMDGIVLTKMISARHLANS